MTEDSPASLASDIVISPSNPIPLGFNQVIIHTQRTETGQSNLQSGREGTTGAILVPGPLRSD
jgi:hypothetical protein